MKNSLVLKKIIQSFLVVVSKKTSQKFTVQSMNYILKKYKSDYRFLESIIVNTENLDDTINVEVKDSLGLQYADKQEITDFLEIVFKEVFKEILQDEFYYKTDLQEIADEVLEDIGFLLDKFGIKIRWIQVIQGATGEVKGKKVEFAGKKYSKKSDVLKPLINSLVDLLYEGMLKKDKKRSDAISVIVKTIRELERKHKLFKFMLLEDIDKDKIDYGIKTQWKIEDVFFFDSQDEYGVKAVSRIDQIDKEKYKKAIKEFILTIGSYINVKDRPYYIERLRDHLDSDCIEKFIEIGIDLDEIEEIFKKQGYNDVIKKTLEGIIEIISSKTSNSYALIALNTIFNKVKESEHGHVISYITVDLDKKGVESIDIDSDINNIDSYEIAKTLTLIIKKTQENQSSHAEKASFIKDLKREVGDRYFEELQKMGVNVNLIDMRYV